MLAIRHVNELEQFVLGDEAYYAFVVKDKSPFMIACHQILYCQ
jgi:hypothetical protein